MFFIFLYYSLQAGNEGILTIDPKMIDLNAHFNRERIPARVVHANGVGVYGHLLMNSTNILGDFCKANVFQNNTKTDCLVRFSGVTTEQGEADTEREPRGFAIKLYTTEGNLDLVCNNVPVFFIRDPILFPSLIHSQKRNPTTHLKDPNAFWDFISSTPESLHAILMMFSDRGIPLSFRHQNGFANHTFRIINKEGKGTWVKFHFTTKAGVKSLTSDAAEQIRGLDSEFFKRDLFYYLENGNTAEWLFQVQLIPEEDVPKLPYDIFDVTKVIPHSDYPLHTVGTLKLTHTVNNFFEEVEQAAFCPGNLVNGIEPSPDKVLQARLILYSDAQRYRLGTNFHLLNVNHPRCPVHSLNRDGFMVMNQPGPVTNFFTGDPVSGGAQGTLPSALETNTFSVSGTVGRKLPEKTRTQLIDDFYQPRVLYEKVMNTGEQHRTCANIAAHLQNARPEIRHKVIALLRKISDELGNRVSLIISALIKGEHPIRPTASIGLSGHKFPFTDLMETISNEREQATIAFFPPPNQPLPLPLAETTGQATETKGSNIDDTSTSRSSECTTLTTGTILSSHELNKLRPVDFPHLMNQQSAITGVSKYQHPLLAMSSIPPESNIKAMAKDAVSSLSAAISQMTLPGENQTEVSHRSTH